MSDARVSTARAMIWFTRRMTGASLARSRRRSASSSDGAAAAAGGFRGGGGIEPVERRLQLQRHRDGQRHAPPGRRLHRGRGELVQRVHDRQAQPVPGIVQRQHPGVPQEPAGEPFRQDGGRGVVGRGRDGEVEAHGERFREVTVADEAELPQHGVDPLARLGRDCPRAVHGPGVDPAAGQQQVQQRGGALLGALDWHGGERHRGRGLSWTASGWT